MFMYLGSKYSQVDSDIYEIGNTAAYTSFPHLLLLHLLLSTLAPNCSYRNTNQFRWSEKCILLNLGCQSAKSSFRQ